VVNKAVSGIVRTFAVIIYFDFFYLWLHGYEYLLDAHKINQSFLQMALFEKVT